MTMLGAHLTIGPRNGFGNFLSAKPRLVVAVDDGGALLEAEEKSGGHTVTVFRDTSVYLEAPPDFNTYSGSMADLAAYWYPQIRHKWAQNQSNYYTITNEIGGNDPVSIGRLIAYERAFMRLANADGYKVCVLNCAGGSPGDFQLWKAMHAPFILEAWAAGNIYGRHAYGGDLVDAQGRVMGGNPSRPIEEAAYLRTLGFGGIAITECGLDGGFGYAGEPRFSQQMIGYEKALRPYSDMIIGMAAWTLGYWQASNANWQNSLPTLTTYMQANPTPPWTPTTPPPPDPPPTGDNLLPNPSYEGGWWHINGIPELQIADDWNMEYKQGSVTTQDGYTFNALRPECRVLPKSQLPPSEQSLFVLEGNQTVKVFKGSGAIEFKYIELAQVHRQAGRYELVMNVYPDLVMAYQNGQKVFADDPLAGEYRWYVNGVAGEWKSLFPYGAWDSLLHAFDWPGGPLRVGIQLRSRFALANSGFFLDAHSLELVEDDMDVTPPAKIKHQIVLMPQDTTLAEQDAITHELYPQRTGFTYSADLAHAVVYAGTPDSKVIIYGPERWANSITAWMETRNINYETRPMPDTGTGGGGDPTIELTHWPTTRKLVTQSFGNNPEHYAQFGFPGHEGVDLDSPFDSPYFAAAAGQVTRVTDREDDGRPSVYGWHCVIDHGVFSTLYAHARDDMSEHVQVGQQVAGGQIVGYSGNTGQSSGPHLHFTLKIRDYVAPGWDCCPGYADPWPYLNPIYNRVDPPKPPLQEGWVSHQFTIPVGNGLLMAAYALNMRDGPNINSYKYGVVREREIVQDLGQRSGIYAQVSASISSINDYTPRPVKALIGLHAGADSNFLPGEPAAWKAMRPTIAKVLSSHNPDNLQWVKANFTGLPIIVRAFLSWGERYISPSQFINDTMPDMKRTMAILNDGRPIYMELPGNEMNLEEEGWLHSWQNGREYAAWAQPVLEAYKAQFPGADIYFPGLSPGGSISGYRADSWNFLAEARASVEASDGLCIHVYIDPPGGYTVSRALDEVRRYRTMFPNKPILVSEFSWNKNDGTPPEKATSYLEFWSGLASIPQANGVVWFVASASNPAWSWYSGSGEVLVENGQSVGIAEIVGRRA